MKSLRSIPLLALAILSPLSGQEIFRLEPVSTPSPDLPDSVKDLVEFIYGTEINPFLLTANSRVQSRVEKVTVLEPKLVILSLSDGHGIERILMDCDDSGSWKIIRKSPSGDWKPEELRNSGRLGVIPFPGPQTESKTAPDSQSSSPKP